MANALRRLPRLALIAAAFAALYAVSALRLVNPFYMQILQYIGIYSIMTLGLNLVNGYLGDFSLGHAGFMAVGAYSSSILSIWVLKGAAFFPLNVALGGLVAVLVSFVVAIPSFKIRGDYLAIITLGFSLIMKSLFENIEALGGPRGLRGIPMRTNAAWIFLWLVVAIAIVRRFIASPLGRGVIAVREDETAAQLSSVDTRRVKFVTFALSAFLLGVAGSLMAHLLSFINPNTFGLSIITEGLIMVYLGGIASVTGSILGAGAWSLMVEILRPLGVWRWIVGALLLVFLMVFRPTGIMGNRELDPAALRSSARGLLARARKGGR